MKMTIIHLQTFGKQLECLDVRLLLRRSINVSNERRRFNWHMRAWVIALYCLSDRLETSFPTVVSLSVTTNLRNVFR